MNKRFKISFIVLAFGWFPMMFLHAASVNWSREYGLYLILATFLICFFSVMYILMMSDIDHIFKRSETLNKEISEARKWSLQSHRWAEAVKREAAKIAGLSAKEVGKTYEKLIRENWKP